MDYLERFESLVARPDDQIDLGRAALTIGYAADPHVQEQRWLDEMDEYALGVDGLDSLCTRLFDELGFAGDTEDYYDPQNSFLHRTIERRKGIPITLSVLTMEVGRRAGFELEGVGMPGHFLVRMPATGQHIDPFFGGTILDEQGCEQRFRQITGAGAETSFGPDMLPVVGKRQILSRMLNNLKAIYRSRADGSNLEWVVRMRMAIPEVGRLEVVDLGRALALQGDYRGGAEEIDRVAAAHPELSDRLRLSALSLRSSLN